MKIAVVAFVDTDQRRYDLRLVTNNRRAAKVSTFITKAIQMATKPADQVQELVATAKDFAKGISHACTFSGIFARSLVYGVVGV